MTSCSPFITFLYCHDGTLSTMRDQILGGPEPTKAFNSQMSLDGGKQSQVDTTLYLEIFPYIIDIMSSARGKL